ncbi:tRNA pseudouridine(13) synthase TruD [Campylobacter troglodytis]|uniref:tRNA pseudouridine(13) synthase TruD n=1 Tax=Campylobacter troglodytis TaxID=654363 RepID=UPI003D055003
MNLDAQNEALQANFKPLRTLTHAPINSHFSKNADDFVVREVPLYEFSGNGEHLILHICKKDLTTNEALQALSEQSGAKMRDFGIAGLKDKQGQTFQYISIHKKFEQILQKFTHEKLKIISTAHHDNKLKIGHLKGNSFFIRLKKVSKIDALKLEQAFEALKHQGFANYFGYQRFGKFKDNFAQGLEILQGEKRLKNLKIQAFLLSAFQSELFNRYLAKRVQLSHFVRDFNEKELAKIYPLNKTELKELKAQRHFFKLLRGEVLGHYPYGKCFVCEDLEAECERFLQKNLSPLGLILGKKAFSCDKGFAKALENEVFAEFECFASQLIGSRRYLWSFLEDAKSRYDEEKAHFCLEFFLQKGSYATVILEELLQRSLQES